MNTRNWLPAVAAGLVGIMPAARADEPTSRPAFVTDAAVDRSFAVVVSDKTYADPDWKKVADALTAKHGGRVIQYTGGVTSSLAELKRTLPRYAAFVATPAEAGRRFVIDISKLTRALNDDPYGDLMWGIVTGHTPADAMRIVSVTDPLVVHKAGAGTGIPLRNFDSGKWFSESVAGEFTTKEPGKDPVKQTGSVDSTTEIVDFLNDDKPDLFITSGHASEGVWALGYKYKNGAFVSHAGRMYGRDLDKKLHPVDSPNPKIFVASGNCLMGHINGPDSMALAWMGSGGVDQFVGYTVVTWYGAMGWGAHKYLMDRPGEHSLAESFYFGNQSVVHDLSTQFPAAMGVNLNLPESDGNDPDKAINESAALLDSKCGALPEKEAQHRLGLAWDRDVVAFYGDPLWDARIAPTGPHVTTALTKVGDVYHFTAVADDTIKIDKPVAMLLPRRLSHPTVLTGRELDPVVTDNFVMLFNTPVVEKGKVYEVTFSADDRPAVAAK